MSLQKQSNSKVQHCTGGSIFIYIILYISLYTKDERVMRFLFGGPVNNTHTSPEPGQ